MGQTTNVYGPVGVRGQQKQRLTNERMKRAILIVKGASRDSGTADS